MVIAPDLQVGAFLSEAVATLGKEGRLNQGRDRCIAGSAMGMEVRGHTWEESSGCARNSCMNPTRTGWSHSLPSGPLTGLTWLGIPSPFHA